MVRNHSLQGFALLRAAGRILSSTIFLRTFEIDRNGKLRDGNEFAARTMMCSFAALSQPKVGLTAGKRRLHGATTGALGAALGRPTVDGNGSGGYAIAHGKHGSMRLA